MRNSGLEETQAGIKIAGRNINNLRYTGDTTLMAECEEELKSLLTKMKKESEKVILKLNIKKTKIMASGPLCMLLCKSSTLQHIMAQNYHKAKVRSIRQRPRQPCPLALGSGPWHVRGPHSYSSI